jgi:hypothetical protein
VRRRVCLTLLTAAVVAVCGVAQASWQPSVSASQTVSAATLGAPVSPHCTASLGVFVPVTFAWSLPTALTGKSLTPLTYTVERRANAGSWSTLATGVTATSYSDNPSALLALGTTWQYRVTAVYGSWTSPVSTSVSAVYTQVALITVLSSCSP